MASEGAEKVSEGAEKASVTAGQLGQPQMERGRKNNVLAMTFKNKAVYTALVAPRRPKSESITDGRTDQPTDGRAHAHIESLRRD